MGFVGLKILRIKAIEQLSHFVYPSYVTGGEIMPILYGPVGRVTATGAHQRGTGGR